MNGYNTFNYGYPGGPAATGGYFFNEPQKLQMTQGLTPEQIKSLRKSSGFSLDISEDELLRTRCTHRTTDKFMVTQDDAGDYTCALCGTKFTPFDGDVNDARDLVKKVLDLLETTKLIGITLPPQTIQDVYQIEPILKRVPDLYEQCLNDYRRATGNVVGGYEYGQNNNAFAMYQNMINPMAGNGYYDPAMQQPMYGAQPAYAQPMYGQPMQQPMMQQPMYGTQPMYAQPMQQPMMQGNPFNVNNAPVANTAQPTAPVSNNNDQVTVTKTLTD